MTKTQKVCAILSILVLTVGAIIFGNHFLRKPTFTPPPMEVDAVEGVPSVPSELGYFRLKQEGTPYSLHVCGVCAPDATGQLDVYFTNDQENEVLLALEVYKGDTFLGKTGILRPNEYVKSVQVETGDLDIDDEVTYKIVSYNIADYSSMGNVVLNTKVSKYKEIQTETA